MARRSRHRDQQFSPITFAQDDVREAFQRAMLSDVELLGVIADHAQMYKDGDQIQAFTTKEREHIEKAVGEIRMARKRLNALGRRKRG